MDLPRADELEPLRRLVADARRITVLTGAGISTDSGIPDFRGPKGVWTRNPEAEKQATLQHYLADPEVRRRSWVARLDNPAWTAEPNPGHLAIARLERQRKLRALVTQNVDGLHQASGIPDDKVIEVHGTMHFTRCWGCDDVRPMRETLDRVRLGEDDPPCLLCGGILKSDTISFGQNLVPEVIDDAFAVSADCDLFLAVGSTLQVFPVARCVPIARSAGATVVIVNGDPTAMDDMADLVVNASITHVLTEVCG